MENRVLPAPEPPLNPLLQLANLLPNPQLPRNLQPKTVSQKIWQAW